MTLRIVTCDVPSVVQALATGYFRRSGVDVIVVGTAGELVERTMALAPDVVIAAAPRGRRLAAATVARLRRLMSARGALILATTAESIERVEVLEPFDGVISTAEPDVDLMRVLSDRLPAPRQAPRRAVELPVLVYSSRRPRRAAVTVDLAVGGVGLIVSEPPLLGAPLQLLFEAGAHSCLVRGEPIWAAAGGAQYRCGIRFIAAAAELTALLANAATARRKR